MRTGTQLFLLCAIAVVLCLVGSIFEAASLAFLIPTMGVLLVLYVANIFREHYYVMRESRIQKFEVDNYWAIANKHPEILSDKMKRGMGFES